LDATPFRNLIPADNGGVPSKTACRPRRRLMSRTSSLDHCWTISDTGLEHNLTSKK
jgi:hypothetical protein